MPRSRSRSPSRSTRRTAHSHRSGSRLEVPDHHTARSRDYNDERDYALDRPRSRRSHSAHSHRSRSHHSQRSRRDEDDRRARSRSYSPERARRRSRSESRDLYDVAEAMCSPLKGVWKGTYMAWDKVCYGVGSMYYKVFPLHHKR